MYNYNNLIPPLREEETSTNKSVCDTLELRESLKQEIVWADVKGLWITISWGKDWKIGLIYTKSQFNQSLLMHIIQFI